ncbi:hypothetical protein LV178_06800, partial [Burkholderia mallei]|nr:hypothetical protein [Burkholderia mallei]
MTIVAMGAIGAGPVRRNATGRDGHSAVRLKNRDAFPIPRPVRAAENARMLERPAQPRRPSSVVHRPSVDARQPVAATSRPRNAVAPSRRDAGTRHARRPAAPPCG